jgi:uncharacterized protein YbjT (DUF2867 family)
MLSGLWTQPSRDGGLGRRSPVVLSFVGTNRLPGQAYDRTKIAQEKLIAPSGIPYTTFEAISQ